MHNATENESASGLAWLLTLAGAIPFVAAATGLFLAPVDLHARIVDALSTYASAILSFLGGIQWGVGVSAHASAPRSARTLFAIAVVVSLAGWSVLFIEARGLRIGVTAGLFALVWAIDGLLCVQHLVPRWFFRVRSVITAIVVAALLTVVFRV